MDLFGEMQVWFHGGARAVSVTTNALQALGLRAACADAEGFAMGKADWDAAADILAREPELAVRGRFAYGETLRDFFSLRGSGAFAWLEREAAANVPLRFPTDWAETAAWRYERDGNGGARLTQYLRWDSEARIPAEIDGLRVSVFQIDAFSNNALLRSVHIPLGIGVDHLGETLNCTLYVEDAALYESLRSAGYRVEMETAAQFLEFTARNGGAWLTRAEGVGTCQIPAEWEGLPLVGIDRNAFRDQAEWIRIDLPQTVRWIAADAFHGCAGLEQIALPAALESVGARAFFGCARLERIDLPQTVREIEVGAFSGCIALRSAALPSGCDEVAPALFSGCRALRSARLPDSISAIGESAFLGCESLECVDFPSAINAIGAKAFQGCFALREIVLPNAIQAVSDWLCYGCRSLAKVILPNSARSIGEGAFSGCTVLSEIALPTCLEEIGENAFSGCNALPAVTIPESVTRIAASGIPRSWTQGGTLYLAHRHMLVRAEVKRAYAVAEGTRYIADGALAGNADLTELSLPEGLTALGRAAAADCVCLRSVSIPDTLARMGEGAFRNCAKLETVALPANLEFIPDHAFSGCSALREVRIEAGPSSIGEYALSGCRSLKSLELPEGILQIGAHALYRCTALEVLRLPHTLRFMGASALSECRALREIQIHSANCEGLHENLLGVRSAAIIAPNISPERFHGLRRKQVCLGYALAWERHIAYAPEVEADCVEWMRTHARSLLREALKNDALLRLLLEHNCLTRSDMEALLERANALRRSQAAVLILEHLGKTSAEKTPRRSLW
ncbi:MAG: leucine-rich repeat domain-containing protein [Clostridia bacterium]|nr:leucine-rich repeat domain-containing protein [Clostridia bacterium]